MTNPMNYYVARENLCFVVHPAVYWTVWSHVQGSINRSLHAVLHMLPTGRRRDSLRYLPPF